MRKQNKLIIANWKMNPVSTEEAKKIFSGIKRVANKTRRVKTVVCPPFIFLSEMSRNVTGSKCVLGAQDSFWKEKGSFTGEVSAPQLVRLGVGYVILGHSERRALGETDETVNKKVIAAIREGLVVILCIGEHNRDTHGDYFHFLEGELKDSLAKISAKNVGHLMVAYEPLWAIGDRAQGADTPESLFEMAIFIRKILNKIFNKKIAMSTPILYGGSVDDKNAESFLHEGGVQGLLVGRASLSTKVFGNILKIADNIK